jgi:YesN/AraC family two-component response regulator
MGFFFIPGIPHEYFSVVEPWEVKWVVFEGSQVQLALKLLKIDEFEVFNIIELEKINMMIENIDRIIEGEETNKILKCSSLLYSLLIEIGDCINSNRSQKNITSHDKLDLVLDYMEHNYNKDISLKEMADLINVSPYFLCRLFKQRHYTTPFKYLIKLRIQKAKQYFFNSPNLLVKDVAHTVGFNDISYFCSVFKEYEGVTPAEFRDMHSYL